MTISSAVTSCSLSLEPDTSNVTSLLFLSNSISTFWTLIVESPELQFEKPSVLRMSAPRTDEMRVEEARKANVIDRMMVLICTECTADGIVQGL